MKKQVVSIPPIVPIGPTRAMASRANASYGGEARAARYEPVILSEWASKGGKAVLQKYGREYFVELRKRRGSKPPKPAEAADPWSSPRMKKYFRTIAARENGRKGGIARARLFYPKCRQAMAREGGIATRNRYGNDFFRGIRKQRKHYAKGYMTRKTKQRWHDFCLKNAETGHWAMKQLWLVIARDFET